MLPSPLYAKQKKHKIKRSIPKKSKKIAKQAVKLVKSKEIATKIAKDNIEKKGTLRAAKNIENKKLISKEIQEKLTENKLPIPRFASLKSSEVNVHTGPGVKYPNSFKYLRKFFPIEIIEEFDAWKKVKDVDGKIGWVHKSLLTGKRHVIVKKNGIALNKNPSPEEDLVAYLENGVQCQLLKTDGNWCKLRVNNDKEKITGWVPKESLWGVYKTEEVK